MRKEFDSDSDSVFTAFLFNALNIYRLNLDPPREPVTEPTVEVLPPINEAQDFTPKEFPAISVAIPMYNVEKYVGECLDSLLAQTFQNFEVIVVDDCSTDNSRAVVESYMSKFDGRLSLVQLEENTGYAGFPRNKGIELARGEYIYFLDPDDTITPTALEEVYSLAKKFNADVVHCEKYYAVPDEFYNDAEYRKTLKPYSWSTKEKRYITQPAWLTNDLEKRIKDFSKRWLIWASWMQFIRRDFLLDNGIRFLNIYSQDMIFTMCELCCAKNYLVVPNCFCYWRKHKASKTQEKQNTQQILHRYVSTINQGINCLANFLSHRDFFAKRQDVNYVLFNTIFTTILERLNDIYREVPVYMLDKSLRKEFDSESVFKAFIFNAMNIYRLQLNPSPKHIVVQDIEVSHINAKGQDFCLKKIPAISVIIPLYNVEEYIGELLDSLLGQTFQDFEVIIVDDCSTDGSCEVVELYAIRFGDRLRLTKTEKNTGSPGEPNNIGIDLSRGEYLLILDDDDTITPDALEILYDVAKNFDADVISCEKFYEVSEEFWYDEEYRKNLKPYSYQKGRLVNKPTLIPLDIAKRVQDCYDDKFLWSLWAKLIRRDFLMENKIRCTHNFVQDMLATYCLIYTAKRFVRVPYTFYFWRKRRSSLSNQKYEPLSDLKKYLNALTVGIKYLDDFLSKKEFFQQNIETKYLALKTYFKKIWEHYIQRVYDKVSLIEREEALRKEFGGSDNIALRTCLFNDLVNFKNSREDELIKFRPFLTSRVDLNIIPKIGQGDIQIVSVSDKQANIKRSTWLKGNEVGYFIQSYTGNLKIVAKAGADGKVQLDLKGVDARDPISKKRIPYWIDYTKLTVNDKVILGYTRLAR